MSESKSLVINSDRILKLFSGFQNYDSIQSLTNAPISLNTRLFSSNLQFFFMQSEEDYRAYWQLSAYKYVIYSDWRCDIQTNSLVTDTSITLTSFFLANSLDIPKSFQRVRSLMKPSSLTMLEKLTAMLMKHGRKTYVSRSLSFSLIQLLNEKYYNSLTKHLHLNWRIMYQVFNSLKFYNFHYFSNMSYCEFDELSDQVFTSHTKLSTSDNVYLKLLINMINKYIPLFSFFIKKTSKRKWKHSRGKSGRYEIKWKYVPTYKRIIVVLRWLKNDIQFQNYYNFSNRCYSSLKNLLFLSSTHLIVQFRQFVHKYVFQRCKNTLLRKLHTEVT